MTSKDIESIQERIISQLEMPWWKRILYESSSPLTRIALYEIAKQLAILNEEIRK